MEKKGNINSGLDLNEIRESVENDGGIYLELSDAGKVQVNDAVTELTRRIIGSNIIMQN